MDSSQQIQQIEHVCKNCGAKIEYTDSKQDVLKCSYCGTEITLVSAMQTNTNNNVQKTESIDYGQDDEILEKSRLSQQHHPTPGQPGISFKTSSYSPENQNGVSAKNPTLNKSKGAFYVGIRGGLILWFIYYIVRAFYDHTDFALSATYYNNILISPMFSSFWVARGVLLMVVYGWLYYLRVKKRT